MKLPGNSLIQQLEWVDPWTKIQVVVIWDGSSQSLSARRYDIWQKEREAVLIVMCNPSMNKLWEA
jgi:hypothetical protein